MSPIPRDISPELVLVDPELAPLARLQLPEPGWLSRQQPRAPEPAHVVKGSTSQPLRPTTAERLKGRALTLLLTLAARSLTLNGFLIRPALHAADSSAAQPTSDDPSLASETRASGTLSLLAGTTAARPPSAALRPPDFGDESTAERPAGHRRA